MKISFKRLALAVAGVGLLTLYGCGGGGGGGGTVTTDVPVIVVDGAIENATVCLDKNANGACDSNEPSGKTDATGKVTLKVDPADVGKYAILAEVGTDAKDADTGVVPVAYTLKAPADKTAVVSPLTTLVQTVIEGAGLSSAAAESQLKTQTGITISLFEDFTKGSSADSKTAGTVARLVVITTQQQTTALVGTVGTTALDGSKITKQNLDKAIQKRLLENLASLKAAASDPAVLAATTPAAKEAALLTQAKTLVTKSDLTADAVATVVAVNNQTVATGSDTATALEQAKTFLAVFESSFATSVPGTGATRNAFSDSCYLDDGYTKAVSIALIDADPALAVQQNKFRIGATRTNVKVLADRVTTNTDGSKRRELDIKYDVNYTDGTAYSDANPAVVTTLISGSSSGSVMASGALCTTPQTGSNFRFYGNRAVVNAVVRAWNQRYEHHSLATGADGAENYSKFIQFKISDPSNFAKYVIVKGPGLPSSGYKMLSVRILRGDPLLAGKNGNYIDWRDTDNFRICLNSTNGRAADVADCAGFGARSNTLGAINLAPALADSTFDAIGFVAGGAYTVAVYNDDGWKTVNGQAAQTPIATYTRTLRSLPYSAVTLAGAGVDSDLFPRFTSSSLTVVQIATLLRSKLAGTMDLSWAALGTLPDAGKFGLVDLYSYEEGRASAGPSLFPASRRDISVYPAAAALTAPGFVIPAASSVLVTPTYAEFGVEYNDRNNRWISSIASFE